MAAEFCAQCGTPLRAGSRFCATCGATAENPPPAASPYPGPVTAQQAAGFFSALFDLSFSEFITTRLIKVLYILAIISIGLFSLVILVAGLSQGAGTGLLALILAAVLFLFYVILTRVWLELIIVVFRIAEYTREIARRERP